MHGVIWDSSRRSRWIGGGKVEASQDCVHTRHHASSLASDCVLAFAGPRSRGGALSKRMGRQQIFEQDKDPADRMYVELEVYILDNI